MSIFLCVLLLLGALYSVMKKLWPEMSKPLPIRASQTDSPDLSGPQTESDQRLERLESLLAEKSRDVYSLHKELKILRSQVRDFDKVKSLLEEELLRLREQNRVFRSELGLPAVQPKENSLT
ncbi:MAG: hypothetical protein KGK03_10890 [Candidatus Omnitrophica bacterium]|nr:hypothetical protein [Candidatus Omnitrophota bacterium]MDE2223562.1 hypothetical protein [Candidatus Omnitrophota bacterium]